MAEVQDPWVSFCCHHRDVSRRLRLVHLRTRLGTWLLQSLANGGCVVAPGVVIAPLPHPRED